MLSAFLTGTDATAGEAVYADYSEKGQIMVGAHNSTTPKGGSDYKNSINACDAALRFAKAHGVKHPTIIHHSDLTGYFCIVGGRTKLDMLVVNVGYGKTRATAERDAFARLTQGGGVRDRPRAAP